LEGWHKFEEFLTGWFITTLFSFRTDHPVFSLWSNPPLQRRGISARSSEISRRSWARNEGAVFAIKRAMEAEPNLKVTLSNFVDERLF